MTTKNDPKAIYKNTPPVIPAIKTFDDVTRALNNLRNWIVGGTVGKLDALNGLVYIENGVVSSLSPNVDIQSVGGLAVDQATQTMDATKFYEITVKGTKIKLAVLTEPT